jgi:hypothetical protein
MDRPAASGAAGGWKWRGLGNRKALALVATEHGHFTPAVPAALAALAIAEDRFPWKGLVPADRQVEADALWARLDALGIRLVETGAAG